MNTPTESCMVCQSQAVVQRDYENDCCFFDCPVCGRFQLTLNNPGLVNDNRLASYLYYNRFKSNNYPEYRYHTTLGKELCDQYKIDFEDGNNTHGRPVHMDSEVISNWYPKTFAERIDRILIKLNDLTNHVGQTITIDLPELLSLLFVDRKEERQMDKKVVWRAEDDCEQEAEYMLNVLIEQCFVDVERGHFLSEGVLLTLTPTGYKRIDDLQRRRSHGYFALVAMKFGDDTKSLREAIRQGVIASGYVAKFIDEVPHNDLITPELLKHIRDSKFVVVDLTHNNNGAYFEEGYAMGLGKPVIQLCKQGSKLHFDIAQKNTIMWVREEDIPQLLENRIRATID